MQIEAKRQQEGLSEKIDFLSKLFLATKKVVI